ncbi:unnamed protein product [Arabidopsis thaliana]|uniref:Uncharacterized protein n=1 Tax=Arabidopsis thaliana TaxID=3702 RepID=A0A5S9XNS7_ARATH|nr:unnamed protein product [Arabidopsis thaliana]
MSWIHLKLSSTRRNLDVGWCSDFFSWLSRRVGLCNYGGSRSREAIGLKHHRDLLPLGRLKVRELTTACRDVRGLTMPRDLWWKRLVAGKGIVAGVGCFLSVY